MRHRQKPLIVPRHSGKREGLRGKAERLGVKARPCMDGQRKVKKKKARARPTSIEAGGELSLKGSIIGIFINDEMKWPAQYEIGITI